MSVAVKTTKDLETAIPKFRKNKHERKAMKIGKDHQEKIIKRE
jgi:hypothetical protein